MTSVAETVLPGPVQASGSPTEPRTLPTVTVKLHEAGLFAASLTEHVTVVTPTLKLLPEGGTQVGDPTPEQLSLAVRGFQVATTGFPDDAKKIFAGQVRLGACVSLTRTVKVQVVSTLFGLASLAVQVTVVTPTTKVEPEAGVQEAVAPGQLSVGVGVVYVTTVEH